MKLTPILIASFSFFVVNAKDILNNPVVITDVYHHQGNLGDKIVLRTANNFSINRVAEKPFIQKDNNAATTVNYFMPHATLSADARQRLEQLKNSKHAYYTIDYAYVRSPVPGLQISISYIPSYIELAVERFAAIHTNQGVAFSFWNKPLLAEIQQKSSGSLKLVQAKKPTVVIDFGHGGSDTGKVGVLGIQEKKINKQVGSRVASLLQQQGFNVVLTRADDSFVPLDKRTTLAHARHADAFISIHANAANNPEVNGTETFYMQQGLMKPLDTTGKNSLVEKFHQARDKKSLLLAQNVQSGILQSVKKKYVLKDRSVKPGVIQVLFGTEMPAALIELGFLTHEQDARMLANAAYQNLIAHGLVDGLKNYFNAIVA